MKRLALTVTVLVALLPAIALAQVEHLIVGTWNVEHLGSPGRGFGGGFGAGNLPKRSSVELDAIANFIRDELKADVLALQEVAITHIEQGRSRSAQLDQIVATLGNKWDYFLPPLSAPPSDNRHNLFNALLWNGNRVNALRTAAMDVPGIELANAALFDRAPVIGYYEAIKGGAGTNDFVLVNLHLASGQDNDEAHLIAVVHVERKLTEVLKDAQVKETDRVILGDFNDNPYARTATGKQRFSPALYNHMEFKRYKDLVVEGFHSTRMDTNLTSVIDHVLISKGMQKHVPVSQADIFLPGDGDTSVFAAWRQTFSDHFPITFPVKIENQDDDVDFQ